MSVFHQRKDQISIMVSDLMMPCQNGPTTIRVSRQIKDGMCVLAITGLGDKVRIAEATAGGAESFVKKPFAAL